MIVKRVFLVLIIGLLSVFFYSCEEDVRPKKKIKSTSSKLDFTSPKAGSEFIYGDSVLFTLHSKDETKGAERIRLFINGELIYETEGGEMKYQYATSNGSGGKVRVKGTVFYSDNTSSSRRIGISIKSEKEPVKMSYQLINTFSHDASSYTQGLVYDSKEDLLFEGTGNYTESRLLKTKLGEEKADHFIDIPSKYFGEGITLMNDTVYQLTYKNKLGFYYDREFNLLGEFSYPTEGWGLTHDGTSLIMSDGSANLYYLNPRTFETEKSVQVFSNKGQLYNINELEYVDGIIYANIYTTNLIAKIDAKSGMLLALINMEGILDRNIVKGKIDVLNGIAFNPSFQTYYVTGKWWPRLFEVRFVEESK